MTNTLSKILDRVETARSKAEAEGYVPPSGTYTFDNREASAVSIAISIVVALLDDNVKAALIMVSALASAGDETKKVLERISNDILEKQCPVFINEAVDAILAEHNQTDKELS